MDITPELGVKWPWESDADEFIDTLQSDLTPILNARIYSKMGIADKLKEYFFTRNIAKEFLADYDKVARQVGRGYEKSEFYSVWEPRFRILGWRDKPELEIVMASFRELQNEGRVPREIFNPAGNPPRGFSNTSPLDGLTKKVLFYGAAAAIGYTVVKAMTETVTSTAMRKLAP